jgi:hypothetical protein
LRAPEFEPQLAVFRPELTNPVDAVAQLVRSGFGHQIVVPHHGVVC